jgi:hypothetical protein
VPAKRARTAPRRTRRASLVSAGIAMPITPSSQSYPDIQQCAMTWPPPLVPCCSRWQPHEHWRQRNRLRARQCAPQCRTAANCAMPAALANQRHGRAISNLCIATNGVRHFEKCYVESRALQRPSCPRSCGRARLRCAVSSAANAYEKWRQGIACNAAADHRYVPFGRRCHSANLPYVTRTPGYILLYCVT